MKLKISEILLEDKENMIEIIYDISQLKGSCYIEVLPGKYMGKCWNKESIFLTEEDFGFIMPIIKKCYSEFDYYSLNEIKREVWVKILSELEKLREYLKDSPKKDSISKFVGFF